MPRKSRIDTPGILQHVIIRGIERRRIFNGESDKENFLDRLKNLGTFYIPYVKQKIDFFNCLLSGGYSVRHNLDAPLVVRTNVSASLSIGEPLANRYSEN